PSAAQAAKPTSCKSLLNTHADRKSIAARGGAVCHLMRERSVGQVLQDVTHYGEGWPTHPNGGWVEGTDTGMQCAHRRAVCHNRTAAVNCRRIAPLWFLSLRQIFGRTASYSSVHTMIMLPQRLLTRMEASGVLGARSPQRQGGTGGGLLERIGIF